MLALNSIFFKKCCLCATFLLCSADTVVEHALFAILPKRNSFLDNCLSHPIKKGIFAAKIE